VVKWATVFNATISSPPERAVGTKATLDLLAKGGDMTGNAIIVTDSDGGQYGCGVGETGCTILVTSDKVGTITQEQLREIAERKLEDLSAHDGEQAAKIIAGTARSMGVDIK